MKRRQLLADLVLLLVTAIWGSTFVMVKDAVSDYPVFAFLAIRFALAACAILPLTYWPAMSRRLQPQSDPNRSRGISVRAGMLIGVFLFASFGLQTSGLRLTTATRTAFITGLSVVIVPLLSAVLWRRRPNAAAAAGVLLAITGLGLLALRGDLAINIGDLLVLGCALALALHILTTGIFAPRADPLRLTAFSMLTVAVLSGLVSLLWETPLRVPPRSVWSAAVVTGLLASAFAFGAQTVAQRFTSATHTALIFVAEPVFAAIFSMLVHRETLGLRAWVGCGLILAGMLAAELGQLSLGRVGARRAADHQQAEHRQV